MGKGPTLSKRAKLSYYYRHAAQSTYSLAVA